MNDSEYRDVVAEMLGQVLPEGDWQTSAASPLRVEGGAWVAVSIWVPNEEETEDPEPGKPEEAPDPLKEVETAAADLGLSVEATPVEGAPGEYRVRIWGRCREEWLWEDVGVKAALAYFRGYHEGLQDGGDGDDEGECEECGEVVSYRYPVDGEWLCSRCRDRAPLEPDGGDWSDKSTGFRA